MEECKEVCGEDSGGHAGETQCGIPLGDIHKQMSKSYSEVAKGPDRPIWAIEGDVINMAQKGFLPYEGCFEHIFLLRSCLEDARRKKR